MTSDLNKVHPSATENMSAKFDEDAHNGFISISQC